MQIAQRIVDEVDIAKTNECDRVVIGVSAGKRLGVAGHHGAFDANRLIADVHEQPGRFVVPVRVAVAQGEIAYRYRCRGAAGTEDIRVDVEHGGDVLAVKNCRGSRWRLHRAPQGPAVGPAAGDRQAACFGRGHRELHASGVVRAATQADLVILVVGGGCGQCLAKLGFVARAEQGGVGGIGRQNKQGQEQGFHRCDPVNGSSTRALLMNTQSGRENPKLHRSDPSRCAACRKAGTRSIHPRRANPCCARGQYSRCARMPTNSAGPRSRL